MLPSFDVEWIIFIVVYVDDSLNIEDTESPRARDNFATSSGVALLRLCPEAIPIHVSRPFLELIGAMLRTIGPSSDVN